jgi:acylphosphatase
MPEELEQIRAELRIYGKVQGVFFRANTQKEAERRNLTGWVMNKTDGTVQAVVEGETEKVEQLVEWAHRGPAAARVEDLDVTWSDPTEEFESFDIRYQ